jgi:hypothetical protein
MVEMVTEEAKLLGEALSTVKIQVQQMKRHLVCLPIGTIHLRPSDRACATTITITDYPTGVRPADGRA